MMEGPKQTGVTFARDERIALEAIAKLDFCSLSSVVRRGTSRLIAERKLEIEEYLRTQGKAKKERPAA
jgi:hypothetical protein